MSNLEWIHSASEEELAMILMCPYDAIEDMPFNELPCNKEQNTDKEFCFQCLKRRLGKEHADAD